MDAVVYKMKEQWNKKDKDFGALDVKLEEGQQLYAQLQAQSNLPPEKVELFSEQLTMLQNFVKTLSSGEEFVKDNMTKLTQAKEQATSRLKQYVQTVQAQF